MRNGPLVDVFVAKAKASAEQILAQPKHQRAIDAVAAVLLMRGSLDGDQVREVVGLASRTRPAVKPAEAKETKKINRTFLRLVKDIDLDA